MRLAQKLTLALILGISAVLAVNGYIRVRREVALFRAERVGDHRLVGTVLAEAFVAVWRTDGEASALAMLNQARVRGGDLAVRWIPRSSPAEGAPGEPITTLERDERGRAIRRTIVPVTIGPGIAGVIDISEALAAERRYVRSTVVDSVRTTVLLALVIAALSAALGAWLVGRPMRSLVDKARRVGRGDFTGPLAARQRDEVGELAREMNAMCAQLVEANEKSAAEAAARLAALEQLRRADRLMTVGKLASGVAHEIGTPLNVIGVRAEMIAGGETAPEEAAAHAQVIVRSCAQMEQIIRQLLDFARPRGPERCAVDVRALARRAVDLLAPMAAKRRVTLALRDEDSPAVAEVDDGQIQQVLANIIVNAVQASAEGGRVDVSVASAHAAPPPERGGPPIECACVRVRDGGEGIAEELLPHIFEPFFTTKDVGQGTGLGLSVAYGIVREHAGWITVESAPRRGAEFAVYLPVGGAS